MFSHPKILFLVSLLFVTLLNSIPIYLLFFYHSSIYNAKQKHLGCKKVRGQSEATLQTGMCDQNSDIS